MLQFLHFSYFDSLLENFTINQHNYDIFSCSYDKRIHATKYQINKIKLKRKAIHPFSLYILNKKIKCRKNINSVKLPAVMNTNH